MPEKFQGTSNGSLQPVDSLVRIPMLVEGCKVWIKNDAKASELSPVEREMLIQAIERKPVLCFTWIFFFIKTI